MATVCICTHPESAHTSVSCAGSNSFCGCNGFGFTQKEACKHSRVIALPKEDLVYQDPKRDSLDFFWCAHCCSLVTVPVTPWYAKEVK
jgi:hypothetical protein